MESNSTGGCVICKQTFLVAVVEFFIFLGDDERKYGVKFTEYVDLFPFENDDMYHEYFEEALRFSSSDDWKEQYFSIDTLRRINKFCPEVIERRAMEIFPFIDS